LDFVLDLGLVLVLDSAPRGWSRSRSRSKARSRLRPLFPRARPICGEPRPPRRLRLRRDPARRKRPLRGM